MAIKLPDKAPGSIVDYPIDFANLLAAGESVTAAVTVIEAGITEEAIAFTAAGIVTLLISGGTEWETYQIRITITTDQQTPFREFERDFCLTVKRS